MCLHETWSNLSKYAHIVMQLDIEIYYGILKMICVKFIVRLQEHQNSIAIFLIGKNNLQCTLMILNNLIDFETGI